jgi:hypothetical protein
VAYTILTAAASSTDANYNNLDAANVSVTNTDNDTAGITVNPTSGLTTTEAGGTAAFTIALTSHGQRDVDLTSKTPVKARSRASMTFTAANWNTPNP